MAPGGVVLRSDVFRKRPFGVAPAPRLGPEGYAETVTAQIYGGLCAGARTVIEAGYAAVCDAVYVLPGQREAIERTARDAGTAFTGLWLEAPAAVLQPRLDARSGDASDATVELFRQQIGYDFGEMAWHRLDASDTPERMVPQANEILAKEILNRTLKG